MLPKTSVMYSPFSWRAHPLANVDRAFRHTTMSRGRDRRTHERMFLQVRLCSLTAYWAGHPIEADQGRQDFDCANKPGDIIERLAGQQAREFSVPATRGSEV